jgi:hypothetical protein
MKVFSILCGLAGLVFFAGCSGPAESGRPGVYRGGQSYENAVHAGDLKER